MRALATTACVSVTANAFTGGSHSIRPGVRQGPHCFTPKPRTVRPSRGACRVFAMAPVKPKVTFVTTTTPELLLKLQNGSDVRGVALEGVAGESVMMNEEATFLIAEAFVEWLAVALKKDVKDVVVAVGRDPRLSGPNLANACFAGFESAGCTRVVDLEIATTPACFMSTISESTNYDAAVMLTASHLPFNRNGAKFFTKQGGLNKNDIAAIVEAASAKCEHAPGGHLIPQLNDDLSSAIEIVETKPFLPLYAAQLRRLICDGVGETEQDKPLRGMKIAVDAGNGSGGFFATDVLAPLGADVSGSQFLDPDGTFPNHSPNPEDAAAMASAVGAVLRSKSDLGVVFDTDVDRSAVIDAAGLEINRNKLIAVLAAIVLREHPGTTIVTDSVTSDGLAAYIQNKGGKHLRYMRGYKNVIDKGVALNDLGEACFLMIETSGHGAMRENHNLDDGAFLAVKIIVEAVRRRRSGGEGIADLLKDLKEPKEEAEVRLKITGEDFKPIGALVIEGLKREVLKGPESVFENSSPVSVNHEGYRVCVDEGDGKAGWFLLRQSLHDPVCVLNFESDAKGGVKKMAKQFLKWFDREGFQGVDVDTVRKIAK